MKVLLVIDHFGSGGAQRQIVELACGLKGRGHDVQMFVYFPQYDFFRARLDEQGIIVHEQSKHTGSSLGVAAKLARLARRGAFDIVASYLSTANVYAELARLAAPRTRLVVSERTTFHDDKSAIGATVRRLLHVLADRVVANSQTQAKWLRRRPWLKRKVSCIYNGVDLDVFRPHGPRLRAGRGLRFLGVGRIGPEKNLLNLLAGLARFGEQFGYVPEVGWAGQRDPSPEGQRYGQQLEAMLASLPAVRERWNWLGLQTDVATLMSQYDVLIHPSYYEGLPNVVCEALAAGMPVLASNVCDHPLLVPDGDRGLLFDPGSAESIAVAIARFSAYGADALHELSRNAREYAVSHLSMGGMIGAYEALFATLAGAQPDPVR